LHRWLVVKKTPYLNNDQTNQSETTEKSRGATKEDAIVIKAHGDINSALDEISRLTGGGQPNTTPGA
jgi:hypothetical protein